MSARLTGLLVFATLLVFPLRGEMQISFEYFPYMDQLPSSSVRRVLQDSEGYMWFGTLDGVCRYDGYQVRTFRSDMHNPSLLTNNEVQSLAEDKQNRIWIGTKQGINLLDRNTLNITPFDESPVQGDNINALACDDKGNMWIATPAGFVLLRQHPQLFKNLLERSLRRKKPARSDHKSCFKRQAGQRLDYVLERGLMPLPARKRQF